MKATEAREALEIMCKPGSKMSDPKWEEASLNFEHAIKGLEIEAGKAEKECKTTSLAISSFKDRTHVHKESIINIKAQTDKALPNDIWFLDERKEKLAQLDGLVINLVKLENSEHARLIYDVTLKQNHPGIQNMMNLRSKSSSIESENIRRCYMLNLNTKGACKHMHESIEDVVNRILKAEDAFQVITAAFSTLQRNLDRAYTKFQDAAGHTSATMSSLQRNVAFKELDEAARIWTDVVDFATRFHSEGLILRQSIEKAPEATAAPEPVEILSTNFGGTDVTAHSLLLFPYDNDLRIRSASPGFRDPWVGVIKTISLVHRNGEEERLFVCKESTSLSTHEGPSVPSTDVHTLKLGPIELAETSNAFLSVLNPVTHIARATVQILAVVWGPVEVRDERVWIYCYSTLLAKQSIEFTNEKMGGDTWPGNPKTGVIFFRLPGSPHVRQVTGREHQSIPWPF